MAFKPVALQILSWPQACISVAYITPQTTAWVYEEPTKIQASVVLDGDNTTTDTITIYNSEFNWRGEFFLVLGTHSHTLGLKLIKQNYSDLSAENQSWQWCFIHYQPICCNCHGFGHHW